MAKSLVDQIREWPVAKKAAFFSKLSPHEAKAFRYNWALWGRPNQRMPSLEDDWLFWLRMCGRGEGKTRSMTEAIRELVQAGYKRIGLIGQNAAACRDTMVEGESGLLAVFPPWELPKYEPSKRKITFSNGAIATCYSAETPDQLRGPQHDALWFDELAAFGPTLQETWDMAMFGLRLGKRPRVLISTTPRPLRFFHDMIKDPRCRVSRGSLYDNAANLPAVTIENLKDKYAGTSLGAQELEGELLEEMPGALWRRTLIAMNRVEKAPDLERVVVGVDPATTVGGNETGIVVCGRGYDGHGYVLEDATVRGSPHTWASRVVEMWGKYGARYVVAESNQGGELVRTTIHNVNSNVPIKLVHASQGKIARAQPVVGKTEQGKVHHVGEFRAMEDQMCTWNVDDPSPDRLDACVHALSELILGGKVWMVGPGGSAAYSPNLIDGKRT